VQQGNRVDSHTVLYGVIGDPIRHSKSPLMMNCAFRQTGINGIYTAFHITASQLAAFIGGVRAMDIRGVNVTIPHKLDVMPHLDHIDESARLIGAVNTIVNNSGVLIGYNTDGLGYVRSLKEEVEPNLAGKRVVILGAGGAARGIIYGLAQEQVATIAVANRTFERAARLAEDFSLMAEVKAAGWEELETLCKSADLVINTTSVGMYPYVDETPASASWLKESAIASDLIYNPLETRFLREARLAGCRTHGGLGMFIYQGAYAFEYWTGQTAPAEAMRSCVLQALEAAAATKS